MCATVPTGAASATKVVIEPWRQRLACQWMRLEGYMQHDAEPMDASAIDGRQIFAPPPRAIFGAALHHVIDGIRRQDLKLRAQELASADRCKDEFLAMVAH